MTHELPSAAIAVIVWAERVLVVQRRIPDGSLVWQFPGGKMEPGEDAARAVCREAWEETGLSVEATQGFPPYRHPVTGRVLHYVACRVTGVWGRTDSREVVDFGWFDMRGVVENVAEEQYAPVLAYLEGMLA